jgi:hypothetical protein
MVVATPSTLYTMWASISQLQIARRVAKGQTKDSSGCELIAFIAAGSAMTDQHIHSTIKQGKWQGFLG